MGRSEAARKMAYSRCTKHEFWSANVTTNFLLGVAVNQVVVIELHKAKKQIGKGGISYFERGSFEFHSTGDVFHPRPGQLKFYEFHRTVSDWEGAPLFYGLPELILIVGKKVS